MILLEGKLHNKDIDFIIFGEYPSNLMNTKASIILIQSLSFTWKVPIIRVNSLLTLSLEAFFLYGSNYVLVLVETNKNTFVYCKCVFVKKKLSYFYLKELISIKEFEEENLNNFILIINCSKNIVNFFKSNYRFIKIKENVLPKSLYSTFIADELIFKIRELSHNNINPFYSIKNQFTKYTY